MKTICLAAMIYTLPNVKMGTDRRDMLALKRAEYVCKTDKRYIDQPCLSQFLKREDGVYWVLCGEKKW